MAKSSGTEVLGEGRFLRLVRRDGWEIAERTNHVNAAFIAVLTKDDRLILTKEFRIPVGKIVVGFPAGLIGDLDKQETLEEAVKRELIEEAGYEARKVTFLTEGPTSAGLTSELIVIVLAEGLKKVGAGGGIEGENIAIHEVPLAKVHGWLQARVREGCLIDPKVYTGLYFIERRRRRAKT